ncbi:enolase C-terminal domain-like protein [Tardisphaera miroshnichenkoae]
MKIKNVESTTVALPLKYTLRHSGGAHPGRLVFTIVRVETDEGITGYGETGGGGFSLAPFVDSLRAQLVGEDPFNVRRLRYKVASPITATYYNQLLPQIWFPIETALLDIKGKSLGVPVHDLLGGSMRDEVGVSAYVFHTEKSYTPEAVAQEAKNLADQYGFKVIKLKAGVFKPQHDADTAIAVSERVKGARIRVDPNGAWSLSEALWFASEMKRASVNIEYMEDPVWTMEDMRAFRRATGYAVATNTVVTRFEDMPNAFLREAVDVVLGDPHWWYGMTGYLELAATVWSLGMELGMHSPGESGLGLTAMVHAASCAPNLAYAIDTHYVHLADDLIKEKLVIRNGHIPVPNKPGLGVTVDEDKIYRYEKLFKEEGGYSYSSDSARGAWIPTIPRGSYDSCPCHPD